MPTCKLAKTGTGQKSRLEFHCQRPAGLVIALVDLRSCLIDSFGATPERSGLGSIVLPMVFDFMKERGCDKAYVSSKASAAGFWKRSGFEPGRAPMFGSAFGNYMDRDL